MPNGGKAAAPRKPRNILIYSDGTGQRGGLYFDEARTNIYKLFRATRVAPDSTIDPDKQIAFYDPGLGTLPEGDSTLQRIYRKLYNFISQATGLGITHNIIDCYAALIRLWQPGDRIFVFGFSRGAYTMRCLASVICLCGIPTTDRGGKSLRRDPGSSTKIATRAVKSVYQHVNSPRDEKYIGQRAALGGRVQGRSRAGHGQYSARPARIPYLEAVRLSGEGRYQPKNLCAVCDRRPRYLGDCGLKENRFQERRGGDHEPAGLGEEGLPIREIELFDSGFVTRRVSPQN